METTCTYSLCNDIRRRRLSWLGHILRMRNDSEGKERLVKTAVRVQRDMGVGGSLLMDAPRHTSFAELITLAEDRQKWKHFIKSKFGGTKEDGRQKSHSHMNPTTTTIARPTNPATQITLSNKSKARSSENKQ